MKVYSFPPPSSTLFLKSEKYALMRVGQPRLMPREEKKVFGCFAFTTDAQILQSILNLVHVLQLYWFEIVKLK